MPINVAAVHVCQCWGLSLNILQGEGCIRAQNIKVLEDSWSRKFLL